MTKFEEEVKRPDNGPLTELNNNMQEVFSQYRKLRQYADYLEYDLKQKDEHIQDFKNALNEVSNELSRLSHENDSLKSQLQQQALPFVPECVGEFIEDCKKEGECLFGIFADATRVEHDMPDLVYFWLGDEGNNDELFARAWLDGYTVEKPQLFYIALPNVYGLSDSVFVSKVENGTVLEFTKGKDYALAFTEQEIKSIDERYWKFAVPVEEEK